MISLLEIFPPVQEAFTSGRLVMPADVVESAGEAAMAWGQNPLNSALIVISAVLLALNLRNIYHIAPHVAKCMSRWRWNHTVEASIQLGRTRDTVAMLLVIPMCLVADRFGLFNAEILQRVPEMWSAAAVVGVFLLFMACRFIIYQMLETRAKSPSTFLVAHKCGRTYFILLGAAILAAAGICLVAGAQDAVTKRVLLIVAGAVILDYLINRGQILSSVCNPFATFLYLCALDFVPAGLLVAANILL